MSHISANSKKVLDLVTFAPYWTLFFSKVADYIINNFMLSSKFDTKLARFYFSQSRVVYSFEF